ncbi:MAG: aspartyl/glutamyl-tRNA amidotransferase subunit C [Spirochaetaceae bacterium]|jgi:Asp-tRNA(Asn)/Glu-tRNA(Gln) amidotransferase C subunit|nr:aspartyl/glutamyl-tRNA amidotransferase subunit C [Spirochaetaceae bacterium]
MKTTQTAILDDLKITAELARLNFSEDELKNALPEFQKMLSYFAAMQEADEIFGSAPEVSGAPEGKLKVLKEAFRPDVPLKDAPVEPQTLLERSEGRDGSFVSIPNVL